MRTTSPEPVTHAAGTFPHVHALRDEADADPEIAWEFSVETLVAGLRAQIRRAKTRQS